MSQLVQYIERVKQYYTQLEPYLLRFKVPQLLLVLLLILIGYQIYAPIERLFAVKALINQANRPLPTAQVGGLNWQSPAGGMFGDYSVQTTQNLPLTTLPLKLAGLGMDNANRGAGGGWALITLSSGKTNTFRVGDFVAGAQIKAIEPGAQAGQPGQVVLFNNGRKERLIMQVPVVKPGLPGASSGN